MIMQNTGTWPDNVNTDFFSFRKKPVDNSVTSEFIGGNKIVHARNTRMLYEYSLKVSLNMRNGEHESFFAWFSSIGGKAGIFLCPALGNGYYRFREVPEDEDEGLMSRNVALEIEEVY